jgi:glyoxalase family protein
LKQPILGIHHITAIAGDPQRNLDFYTVVLGLRLVKLTVNFDDPGTYHFYFGNGSGAPGTILTFFPYPGAVKGRPGAGQADAIAFSVPEGALGYWSGRLAERGLTVEGPSVRFGQQVLAFADPDGLSLELIEAGAGAADAWLDDAIPAEFAIRGFFGITLAERQPETTAALLTETMGLRLAGQEGTRYRYQVDGAAPGSVVDVLDRPNGPHSIVAAGSVHHVAFRAPDDAQQAGWREMLVSQGFDVSPVMDRIYFHSIYFREPGGVLFEIATDTPGFAIDETAEELGTGLRLPPWLEPQRSVIEGAVPPVRLPQREGRPVS